MCTELCFHHRYRTSASSSSTSAGPTMGCWMPKPWQLQRSSSWELMTSAHFEPLVHSFLLPPPTFSMSKAFSVCCATSSLKQFRSSEPACLLQVSQHLVNILQCVSSYHAITLDVQGMHSVNSRTQCMQDAQRRLQFGQFRPSVLRSTLHAQHGCRRVPWGLFRIQSARRW
jgi:hypothetical protein